MIRLLVACLLCVWLSQADILAQDALPATSPEKTETVIRRAPLDAIISGEEGKRIIYLPLPGGWSPTIFDELLDILQKRDQQNLVPTFTLRNVSATGTIVDNRVETDVRIEFSTSGDQPVRIPLGFKEGILPSADSVDQSPFRYTGNGSALLDSIEGQYVVIVVPQTEHITGIENSDKSEISEIAETPETSEQSEKSEKSEQSEKSEKPGIVQQHTLAFSLWLPLSVNSSGEYRLPLSFPRTLTSQFQLEVPMGNVTASVTQGSILTEEVQPQSTLLTVQGLRSDTEITWKKMAVEIVDDRPVLLVERAAIDVRLNAQSVVYDATLPISSATGSFEQLQIRLPQGSVLDREAADRHAVAGDYSVSEVNAESVVTIQFSQKTSGPVSLRLRATQQFEEAGRPEPGVGGGGGSGGGGQSDFQRDLSGFEVLGAERQGGVLSVSVFPSEMKPRWTPIRGIRREVGSVSAATTSDTRFEFNSQPFLLSVQVVSPQTRINVKPDYHFHFRRGQIDMTARLSYTVSGFKADVLYFRLPDASWDYNLAASSPVDVADVGINALGELSMPLRTPREGTIEIELNARRLIPTEDEQVHRIVLPMPKPQADWSEPADIMITSADYIEMLPIDVSSASSEQRISGMTRQPRRTVPLAWSNVPGSQQEPLFYRTEAAEAVFAANLIYHQQKINTTMETDIRLLKEYNQVTQTIHYHASYEPIGLLYFLVPDTLGTNGDIKILLDSRQLELRDTIVDPSHHIPRGWKRKMVQLPEQRFKFPLKIEYSSLPFNVPDDVTELCSLSFICPMDVPVSEHRVHLFAPADYRVELQDESRLLWESFRDPRRPSPGAAGVFRSVPSPTVPLPNGIALSISVSEKNESETTIIERAWLQTWLTGQIRHDRVTYLLKTARDSLTLQLPSEATQQYNIAVRVNRQSVPANVSQTGILTIPIAPEQHHRSVEVFVEYRTNFELSGWEVPIALPIFVPVKDTLIQYEFWQVFPPRNQHIIACTGGWTMEYEWTWNGLFLGRTPSIRKSDIGFEPDSEEIISSANQYLFSHLHPSGTVTLYIVSRPHIIFGSSAFALLVGLVLIYVRQSRHIGSLFGLGVGLLAVLLYQPPFVLLMLQAAVFGVFLALGTGYVYRIFHRQKQWIPSTFPTLDELSQTYLTPVPSQTIHEVIIDDSASKADSPAVANHHNGTPPAEQPDQKVP